MPTSPFANSPTSTVKQQLRAAQAAAVVMLPLNLLLLNF